MMSSWRATASLSRAVVVSAVGLGGAIIGGDPVLLVLTVPLVLVAAVGLAQRPRRTPEVSLVLDHRLLHEGQGTRSRLVLRDPAGAEQVTRIAAGEEFTVQRPARGRVNRMLSSDTDIEISPRRWGRRVLGEELVALTSPWAGFRWGPTTLYGDEIRVLPLGVHYDSHAESPQPRGLVGAHRSSRTGGGTEFSGIRAFEVGDRLRRINWRISARSGQLHVTTTRAEEDTAVLLVLDAFADHGRSEGIGGAASSLDLTVRAAAAVAEHSMRQGDRVALRVVGRTPLQVGYGSGGLHLRKILGTLGAVQPGAPHDGEVERLRLHATEGTMVIVLSPMLADEVATVAATAMRRGLPTLVIDTLPADATPGVSEGADPRLADLAWRMRRLEREHVLAGLAGLGCPVVVWRGPGTIDDVARRLARRAQLPQVRAR